MAGTSHSGLAPDPLFMADTMADYPGAVGDKYRQPWQQWVFGLGGRPPVHDAFLGSIPTAGGTRTAAGGGGAASAVVAHVGVDEARGTTFAIDWFEEVHILPRTKIEFGNIITLEQQNFEIFNAYRNTTVTLTTVTNNVAPGVEMPNLVVPEAQGPLSSWLDSSSTPNNAGTGLGTMVNQVVNALADGLPTFDADIVFDFSTGDTVSLFLSGTRIVFIPLQYEAPTTEVLAFLTDVIESLDGHEQRLALRKNPRQLFRVEYALDAEERQLMQSLLMDWMDNVFGFPLWHEKLELTAAVSAGATVYSVNDTSEIDLRVGGLAVVMSDNETFDVINIAAIGATTITAADPSVNGYAKGATIMPLRTARITNAVNGRRFIKGLETFQVEFEVTDNNTGAPAGSTTGWSTYNGRVLLDDCNVVRGPMPESYNRRLYVIDNQTGIVNVRSPWDRYKRTHQKGFVGRNRAEILKLRKLLLAFNGRQKSFYIPTFYDDLTVVANLLVGAATIDIRARGYTRFIGAREPQSIFRIEFTDGTSLVRVVQSSTEVSSVVERLTLDDTWPANRTTDEVERIMFYELVRLDADEISIVYPRIGLASVQVPVKALFDDVV